MRLILGQLPLTLPILVGLSIAGCGVEYPNCESDDDCAEKSEVCVNQQCQECRDTSGCEAKYSEELRACQSGRCDAVTCITTTDCQGGETCTAYDCVRDEPQCATDEDCPEGQRCEEEACVGGCVSDQECGAGMVCQNGSCEAGGTQISQACRPAEAGEVVAIPPVSFDFNDYDLTVNTQSSLDTSAECLGQAPEVTIIIEGHCDQRGTQEFNLALGEKRANAVKSYLRNLGIDTSRMRTLSKGKNEPVCNDWSESCHSENRRVLFLQQQN